MLFDQLRQMGNGLLLFRLGKGGAGTEFVRAAAEDAYDRLIYPSLEREVRNTLTERADEGAIKMFGANSGDSRQTGETPPRPAWRRNRRWLPPR